MNMFNRLSIPALLALLIEGTLTAANASSLPYEWEHDICRQPSCASTTAEDKNAGYIFATSADSGTVQQGPELKWDKPAGRETGKDKDYGPEQVPPGGKPGVIHTGSGKDIYPGPFAAGHYPKPTAVPVPAAAWLLISGAAVIGLGAWKRKRT